MMLDKNILNKIFILKFHGWVRNLPQLYIPDLSTLFWNPAYKNNVDLD